jgi:hypothetical protein
MKEARNAVESAPADNQRASPIRATKMNATSSRLFVDFLFVGYGGKIDSTSIIMTAIITSGDRNQATCFVCPQ